MTFEYSVIPVIVACLVMVGALEIIPLLRLGQYREIMVVSILLTLGMAVFVSRIVGIRLLPISANITKAMKAWFR
jgi:hypothetical protein